MHLDDDLVIAAGETMVHVAVGGVGERPLVVLTPIGTSWFEAALPPAFWEWFRVHVVELPGTGASSTTVPPTVDTVSAAAAAVTDVLGREDSVLFGHSMNGTLALAAAAAAAASRAPCAGVVAVGAPPSLPPDTEASRGYWQANADVDRRARAADLVARFEAATDDGERLAAWTSYNDLRQWWDPDVDRRELEASAVLDPAWPQAVFGSAASVDWEQVRGAVTCPVLLAVGVADFVCPPTLWDGAVAPPLLTVERFERSGHTPFVEEPELFTASVERWLAAIDRGGNN